jgi:hypothetical protein
MQRVGDDEAAENEEDSNPEVSMGKDHTDPNREISQNLRDVAARN